MSCKLWGKVTSVSVNINFGAKMSILCEKNWNLGEMLTFSLSVDYYWKWLSFCKMCLFLEKSDFLCEGLYILTKCQILIKKTILNILKGVFSVFEKCQFLVALFCFSKK